MKITAATFLLSSLFATACASEDEAPIEEEGNAESALVFDPNARCNFDLIVKKYAWSDPVKWDFLGYGKAGEIVRFHDPNDQKLEWREMPPPADNIATGRRVRMKVERNCEPYKATATAELASEGEGKYGFTKSLTQGEEISAGLKIPVPPLEFEIGYANMMSTTWGSSVEFSQKWSHKVSYGIELEACTKGEAVHELRAITVDMGLYGKLKGKRSIDCIFGEPGNHDNKKTHTGVWESSNNVEVLFGTTKSPLKEFKITPGKTNNPITKCENCTGCTATPGPGLVAAAEICTDEPVEIEATVEGNIETLPDVGFEPAVDEELPTDAPKLEGLMTTPLAL